MSNIGLTEVYPKVSNLGVTEFFSKNICAKPYNFIFLIKCALLSEDNEKRMLVKVFSPIKKHKRLILNQVSTRNFSSVSNIADCHDLKIQL